MNRLENIIGNRLMSRAPALRDVVRRNRFGAAARLARAAGWLTRQSYIPLDYAPANANTPRYGYGKPSNRRLAEMISARHEAYHRSLATIGAFTDDLGRIEARAGDPLKPSWVNDWIPGLDSAAIYAFIRARSPHLYLEIGSGNSTMFAARARRDGQLATSIVSIDPYPRAGIDRICDETIRQSLESVDLSVFGRLAPGDVLFFDGSHRTFMNSDVATFFLDVLPELPEGLLVGVHDIYLPDDYPPEIASRYYSEQYMLAAYLLGASGNIDIVLPAMYVSRSNEFKATVEELWSGLRLDGLERHGGTFWFST